MRVAAVLISYCWPFELVMGKNLRTHYPGTWATAKSGTATVTFPSFPQVLNYPPTRKGRIDSKVSCTLTDRAGIRTRARGIVATHPNHCSSEDSVKNRLRNNSGRDKSQCFPYVDLHKMTSPKPKYSC